MPAVSAAIEASDAGAICFAFAYPGACGWGPTEAAAVERLREDVLFTLDWLDSHELDHLAPPLSGDFEVDITQRVPATGDPLQCDSEGFFPFDGRPYSDADVSRTRELLEASRVDLLETTANLSASALDRRLVEGRRTVREILDHVALAEHWYLTRVEVPVDIPAGGQDYPDETFERLTETRADVERVLKAFVVIQGDRRSDSCVVDGERWSPRKVLRRLVWHELLHYKQLARLVPKVVAASNEPDEW